MSQPLSSGGGGAAALHLGRPTSAPQMAAPTSSQQTYAPTWSSQPGDDWHAAPPALPRAVSALRGSTGTGTTGYQQGLSDVRPGSAPDPRHLSAAGGAGLLGNGGAAERRATLPASLYQDVEDRSAQLDLRRLQQAQKASNHTSQHARTTSSLIRRIGSTSAGAGGMHPDPPVIPEGSQLGLPPLHAEDEQAIAAMRQLEGRMGAIEDKCGKAGEGLAEVRGALAQQMQRLEDVGASCHDVHATMGRLAAAVEGMGAQLEQLLELQQQLQVPVAPMFAAITTTTTGCQTDERLWTSAANGGSPPEAPRGAYVATATRAGGRQSMTSSAQRASPASDPLSQQAPGPHARHPPSSGAAMAAGRASGAGAGGGVPAAVASTLIPLCTRSPSPAPSSQRQPTGSGSKGASRGTAAGAEPAAGSKGAPAAGPPSATKKRPGGRSARLLQQAASMPGQQLLRFGPADPPAARVSNAGGSGRQGSTGVLVLESQQPQQKQQQGAAACNPPSSSIGAPSRKRSSPDPATSAGLPAPTAAQAAALGCTPACAVGTRSAGRGTQRATPTTAPHADSVSRLPSARVAAAAGDGSGGRSSSDASDEDEGRGGRSSSSGAEEEEGEEDEEVIARQLAARLASHRSKRLRQMMTQVPPASQPRTFPGQLW